MGAAADVVVRGTPYAVITLEEAAATLDVDLGGARKYVEVRIEAPEKSESVSKNVYTYGTFLMEDGLTRRDQLSGAELSVTSGEGSSANRHAVKKVWVIDGTVLSFR